MSLRNRTVKVKRFAAGSYVSGSWVEGTSSTFDVVCSVQPLKAREMELLSEERRDSAAFRIYSDTELKPADETTKINADLVDIDGGTNFDYEVLSNEAWANGILPHNKTVVAKLRANT
jgi:hypothetical protein